MAKQVQHIEKFTAAEKRALALPQVKNVPATNKTKSRFGLLRRSRVVLESDEPAFKRRFIPSNIRAWIVYIICIGLLAWAGWQLVDYVMETGGAEAEFQEVIEKYVEPDIIPVEQQDPDTSAWPPLVDFAALQADNPEVAGWLRIPGTTVDYPVMLNDVNDYYLHRDMNGNYSLPGSIFADHQNDDLSTDNHIVIYGHHMVTPTMFHDVANYKFQDFFDSHRVIYFETPQTTYVLRAVAMYEVEPTEYDTRTVDFDDSQSYQEYFDSRMARANYIRYEDYNRATSDKLVTLITCNDSGRARQVVECIVEQEYPTSMVPQVIARALSDLEAQGDGQGGAPGDVTGDAQSEEQPVEQ